MTQFIDGPANGQNLMLRNARRFLRVTEFNGKWDALDQPQDRPEPHEKLYAYQVDGPVSMFHIRSGKKGASGFYAMANYKICTDQPGDPVMRDQALWEEWCETRTALQRIGE